MLCLFQCQSDSALTRTYWSSRGTAGRNSRFKLFLLLILGAFSFVLSAILNSQASYRCTLVPGSRFPVPGSRFPVPGSRFPVPGSRFPVPGSRFRSRFPVPGSRFPVPGSRFPVPGSRFPVPRSRFPVPRSPFPVPRSPFPVPRSPFPVPRSPFPVPRSPFPVPRSPFPVPRSPFPVPRSPFPVTEIEARSLKCRQNIGRPGTRDSHTYHCLNLRSIFHVEFASEKTLSGQFAKENL